MSSLQTDQYNIIRKIGEGGMGTVYLAEDILLERKVAIKALNKPDPSAAASMENRFQQEALALARLNHPNITHLYAFITRNESYWMVMEFVEGETLENWVRQKGTLNTTTAGSILAQLLDGLDHAHRKGIIHRDLKPANVMISTEGEVKIMDFGIARIRNSQRLTQLGKSVGTLEYMAPEQVQGKEGDELTDIYAAGNILYEMLTGYPPFRSDSDYALMKAKLEEDAPLPAAISQSWQQFLSTALHRNPQKRFSSARQMKEALQRCMTQEVYQEHQLMTALHSNETRQIPPELPRSNTLANILNRREELFKDKYVGLLVLVVVLCIGLLVWNYFRNTASQQTVVPALVKKADPDKRNNNLSETEIQQDKPISHQTPVSRIDQPAKDLPVVPVSPVKREPSSPEKKQVPTKKTEPKKEPADITEHPAPTPVTVTTAPERSGPVRIPPGIEIEIVLDETLSSEERSKDGNAVRMHATRDLKIDGKTIIHAGAPVVGKIVDVVPSGRRKKALIGFIVRFVQAANGQQIKLHAERFRQQSTGLDEPSFFRAGTSFKAELGRGTVD